MNKKERRKILNLLEKNSRLTPDEIAIMLGLEAEVVRAEIAQMESENIICGYHTIIRWDSIKEDAVTAMVELRVTPQGGEGYAKIAAQISEYPQVESLYLMSGAYDFLVMLKGNNLKEISMFISEKLASIEEVQSTTTHFTLTKYKELGVQMETIKTDGRMVVSP
ncbi:MAG: Lrp/AsnC family transcriptional regulator [Lachnospiraceae bacterium]